MMNILGEFEHDLVELAMRSYSFVIWGMGVMKTSSDTPISFEELHSMPNGKEKGRLFRLLPYDVRLAFLVWEDEKKIGTVRRFRNDAECIEYAYARGHHERFRKALGFSSFC